MSRAEWIREAADFQIMCKRNSSAARSCPQVFHAHRHTGELITFSTSHALPIPSGHSLGYSAIIAAKHVNDAGGTWVTIRLLQPIEAMNNATEQAPRPSRSANCDVTPASPQPPSFQRSVTSGCH